MGFHITDLLSVKHRPSKHKRRQKSEVDAFNNTTMFDKWSSHETNKIETRESLNKTVGGDKFMIKNFRIVNLTENASNNNSMMSKPITAAPMTYNNSRAMEIKRITSGGSRKDKLNSTAFGFRNVKSPNLLPVNNSLLSPDEKGQFRDVKPLHDYFEKMYEETHYMYPKVNILNYNSLIEQEERHTY